MNNKIDVSSKRTRFWTRDRLIIWIIIGAVLCLTAGGYLFYLCTHNDPPVVYDTVLTDAAAFIGGLIK